MTQRGFKKRIVFILLFVSNYSTFKYFLELLFQTINGTGGGRGGRRERFGAEKGSGVRRIPGRRGSRRTLSYGRRGSRTENWTNV